MLASTFRYVVRYPGRAARALGSDPAAVLDTMIDRAVQAREYRNGPFRYEISPDWEAGLHRALGAEWPCDAGREFSALWLRVVEGVRAKGVETGPGSFNGFNDGDAALVRAIWCIIRHSIPRDVVETGVAQGFTSRFALEAMERNGAGHLSSIDRPPLDEQMRKRVGIAVEDRSRWSLIVGSSRRRLRPLLRQLGEIDVFVHDSFHTERNVLFELEVAWKYLAKGGAVVIDDIDTNRAFRTFLDNHAVGHSFVCEAEPVRPDLRRFNQKGLFGIFVK